MTNDRPRNCRARVTSQRQDRHLRLRSRMITADDTLRRAAGLGNVRTSGEDVRRRLRDSGHRARSQVVEPIFKQRHRTAKLACAHARRHWRLHTWQHFLFSDESRCSLRLNDGRYHVYHGRGERFAHQCVGNVLRTSMCKSPTVF